MTPSVIHASYYASIGWALPIRTAIQKKSSLVSKDAQWRDSELSDLAFAIETRSAALPGIEKQLIDDVNGLGQRIADSEDIERNIEAQTFNFGPGATVGLARTASSVTHLVAEDRALFENLATFYREFQKLYFDRTVNKPDSYDHLDGLTRKGWAEKLRRLRHDVVHFRAPWIAFRVECRDPVELEPLFYLDWRPESVPKGRDAFSLTELRELRTRLVECRDALQKGLIEMLEKLPG